MALGSFGADVEGVLPGEEDAEKARIERAVFTHGIVYHSATLFSSQGPGALPVPPSPPSFSPSPGERAHSAGGSWPTGETFDDEQAERNAHIIA
jgi:hypothetical protein